MKIVIMLPTLSMCGTERFAVGFANWLVSKNISVSIISLHSRQDNYAINEKVNVYYCLDNNYSNKIKKFIIRRNNINEILNKEQPDVIFELLYKPFVFAYKYRKKHKNETVIIGSERNNPKFNRGLIKILLSKIVPFLCDGYIFQTRRVMKMFSKNIQKKSVVIGNPISNKHVYEINKYNKKNNEIVTMAKLNDQKGLDVLIKAFEIFKNKYNNKNYKLIIYGEGEKREELEQLVKKLNLENDVFMPGKCENAITKVSKAKIFVLSSRFEGMPNALLEAMAIGMPCIATNCIAGPAELIKNYENGILIEVDDINALSKEMNNLANDELLLKKIGKNAKKVCELYSEDTIYSEYLEYFIKKISKNEVNK